MRDIMTPEQVAEYLQVSTDQVYRLIRGHKLAASRIGRSYRVSKEDVESFLLAYSNSSQVREAMFTRVAEIGQRNAQRFPSLTSDDVLEELEQLDRERTQTRIARR